MRERGREIEGLGVGGWGRVGCVWGGVIQTPEAATVNVSLNICCSWPHSHLRAEQDYDMFLRGSQI